MTPDRTAGEPEARRQRQLDFLDEVVRQARQSEGSWQAHLRAEVAGWLARPHSGTITGVKGE